MANHSPAYMPETEEWNVQTSHHLTDERQTFADGREDSLTICGEPFPVRLFAGLAVASTAAASSEDAVQRLADRSIAEVVHLRVGRICGEDQQLVVFPVELVGHRAEFV